MHISYQTICRLESGGRVFYGEANTKIEAYKLALTQLREYESGQILVEAANKEKTDAYRKKYGKPEATRPKPEGPPNRNFSDFKLEK